MKRCPRCEKTYPDSETFCEVDGSALVGADPAFVQGGGSAADDPGAGGAPGIECPVCGGKAEPGEIICNFCGARLIEDRGARPAPPPPSPQITTPMPPREPPPGPGQARTSMGQPQEFRRGFTGGMPEPEPVEEETGGGILSSIGYLIAALVALVGGAYLAIHLSSHKAEQRAQASPSAVVTPVPSGPMVALAKTIHLQVTGESATAPERNTGVARSAFDNNKTALLDTYQRALGADPNTKDGMIVRIRVMPDGTVPAASVRTSTNPNPSLDASVIKDMLAWNFASFSGGQVEFDYPLVFATDPSQRDAIESDLTTKLASISPTEPPEYTSSAPTPAPSVAPTPAVVAATPVPEAPPAARKRPPRKEVAAKPRPAPTPALYDRVMAALKVNRSLSRAKVYTNPGGSVVLFGRVFDNNAKNLAERTVRRVPGVTSVVNNLTTDTALWAQQQAQVQQQLANAGLPNVTVKIIGKDAFLNGEVKTALDKERAVTVTQGAAPVVVRENLIRVAPGSILGF